jgi:glyoxylase-like metal-dependent hydrolase (beta-lactamase superfamily II)
MVPVDRVVSDGELLWETLRAIALPGGSPGETAYHAPGVLVIGDAVTNLDGLQVLPENYCADLPLLRTSLRALRPLQFDIACFAHGLPIVGRAREKLADIV